MAILLHNSLKPSTRKTYNSGVNRFYNFCGLYDKISLPASQETLILFCAHLFNSGLKPNTIKVYLSAVRNDHIENDFTSPLGGEKLTKVLKGITNMSAPPCRKSPITYEVLCKMCSYMSRREDYLMVKALCCTAFFGCMRGSELCLKDDETFDPKFNVTVTDVEFMSKPDMFGLTLKRSKTDYNNEGMKVFIGCSGTDVCAFCSLKKYLESRGPVHKDAPLFVNTWGSPIKRGQFTDIIRLLVSCCGLNPDDYSGHSMRAGAATTAADNTFEEHEIKMLGRWASNAYQIYLRNPKIVSTYAKRLVVQE